jgi:hypothetical protein
MALRHLQPQMAQRHRREMVDNRDGTVRGIW